MLVAVKLWASRWADTRASITLKSDNFAALSLAARMQGSVSSLICKELALVSSRAAFQPRFIVHVPGVMNFMAHSLSRLWEPGGGYTIPVGLDPRIRAVLPARGLAYYSTLRPKSR